MSKFIKLSVIIISICLAAACCGCGPPLYQIYFDQLFYDDQDVLVVGYRAFENNPDNITKFAKFNTDTYKWDASDVAKKVIADEEITTAKGKTIVKNGDGAVVFEQPVPSIFDIQSQTDIPLPNAEAYYNYFRTGNDYRWDRKTILIKVGINKITDEWGDNRFTGIHSFLAEYNDINSLWNIKHFGKVPGNEGDSVDLNINHPHNFGSLSGYSANRFFINSNPSLCHRWLVDGTYSLIYNKLIKCLVKYDNGEVSLQKLYGEILPAQYVDVLLGMKEAGKIRNGPAPSRVFFDEKQNMYVLYNNTEEAKGKYFYFEMYKPDQPTVAQHKQKIYWD